MIEVIGKFVRSVIFGLTSWSDWYKKACERSMYTEVGFLSGHVSNLDRQVANEKNLKPLNRFEKWLFKYEIKKAKESYQQIFRQACFDVLGEDSNRWD